MLISMGRCPRALRFEARSEENLNYVRGLFLTDGYSHIKVTKRGWIKGYEIFFFLQGNEIPIARRLVKMLRRLGLASSVHPHRKENHQIDVYVSSKSLLELLPSKSNLARSPEYSRMFIEENKLLSFDHGIPFIAGLLDADGYCGVSIDKRPP